MATNTTYFNLIKPAYEEDADVAVLNTDMDRIDSALYNIRLTNAENFAEIYDAAASYSAGDYCVYLQADGYHLYKANASTTGAFDNTKWDEVVVTDELGGGGGGGGHVILDDGGISLTQEDDLQFKGAYSVDDNVNGRTVVNVCRQATAAQFEQMTSAEKKGLIYVEGQSGGGNGGHTIVNDSGTDMSQRSDLQFKGVYVQDDSANDATIVNVVKEYADDAAVQALTGEAAKGFQHTPDTIYRGRMAADIGFDNTDTDFTGTRVQEVLEEISARLQALEAE